MAMNKEATELLKDTLFLAAGLGLIGVPSIAAYLGHKQADAESRLEKDKEFLTQKEKLKIYDAGISSLSA